MPCWGYEGGAGGYEVHEDELHTGAEVEQHETEEEYEDSDYHEDDYEIRCDSSCYCRDS